MGTTPSRPLAMQVHMAVSDNDYEAAVALLRDSPRPAPGTADATNLTTTLTNSLTLAAGKGNAAMLRLLLANGAVVADEAAVDSALCAAARGGFIEAMEVLLAAGARLDHVSRAYAGETPLLAALHAGHTEVAERLVAAGASRSSLRDAAAAGDLAAIAARLAAGEPVDGVVASESDYDEGGGYMDPVDWSDDEHDPADDAFQMDDEAALAMAVASGNAVAVALATRSDEYTRNYLLSPLYEAIRARQRAAVQALLAAGPIVAGKPLFRTFDESPILAAMSRPRVGTRRYCCCSAASATAVSVSPTGGSTRQQGSRAAVAAMAAV